MASHEETSNPLPRLTHDAYTIAIICPMGVELAPMKAMFDEKHQSLPTSRDQNYYYLGRIGQHNAVLSVLPKIGNNVAAIVATQLLNDFKSVRFGLLVGIGGGIPSKDYENDQLMDIRLGDVVVSKSKGTLEGVLQFGQESTNQKGKPIRIGALNKPPSLLSSSVEALRATHDMEGNKIDDYIESMFQRYPVMEEQYHCPGIEHDQLFKPSYPHQSEDSCRNCDPAELIERIPRRRKGPRIHYGTIGSSNQVVRDSQFRDQLREELKVLCVEMEAAGLMEAFPCLVIRGICDYADSHKNKRWQPYAAATAAAYSKQLLEMIPSVDVKKIATIEEALMGISREIRQSTKATQRIETKFNATEWMDILEWLSPSSVNFSSPQNVAHDSHTSGTGQWLLNDPRYIDWRDNGYGLLWLYGIVGCGKTVLCSTIIHDLQQNCKDNSSNHLAYWYFQFSNLESQSVCNMLRSLIRQLCPPYSPIVHGLWVRHSKSGSQPSLEELTSTLDETIQTLDEKVFIVLDALDECRSEGSQDERKKLLQHIEHLHSNHPEKLHFLSTSRWDPDISATLSRIATKTIDIGPLFHKDVELFVKDALNQERLARWGQEITLQIVNCLLSVQERRFRWAQLQIKRLQDCMTEKSLLIALNTIPKTLEDTYQKALQDIPEENRINVRKILMWLTSSLRQMTPEEVAAIVGFPFPDDVVRICTSLLVTIIDNSRAIKLAHFSVKEYLLVEVSEEKNPYWYQFSSALANYHIALTVLDCLLEHSDDTKSRQLREYSAQFWPAHEEASRTINQPELQEKIDMLFSEKCSYQYKRWLHSFSDDFWKPGALQSKLQIAGGTWAFKTQFYYLILGQDVLPPLYYASLFGLEKSVSKVWERDAPVLIQYGIHLEVLHTAAVNGNIPIVEIWARRYENIRNVFNLQKVVSEVESNAVDSLGSLLDILGVTSVTTALLSHAAGNDNCGEAVLKLLFSRGGSDDQIRENVLIAAARNNEAVLKLVLDHGGDAYITEKVLTAAAETDLATLKLVLDRGGQAYVTEHVLIVAAKKDVATLKLVLDRGYAHCITEGVVKEVMISELARPGLRLLLTQGGELHITKGILIVAVSFGPELVRLLLDHRRGDEDSITEDVLMASLKSSPEVLKLLLDHRHEGEGLITKGLLDAAVALHEEKILLLVQLLLKQGTMGTHITEDMLKMAARIKAESEPILQLLLDEGRKSRGTQGVLIEVVRVDERRASPAVKLLLDGGARAEITEDMLKEAVSMDERSVILVVKLLLELGAGAYITESILKAAAGNTRIGYALSKLLLSQGATSAHITEDVLKIAARNKGWGQPVLRLLLDWRGDSIFVTKDVLQAGAENESCGFAVSKLLLDRGSVDCITEDILVTAAENKQLGYAVMKLFLDRYRDNISITEKVLDAAARNPWRRDAMLMLLDGKA